MKCKSKPNREQPLKTSLGLSGHVFLVRLDRGLLLDLVQIHVRNGSILAVDDLGQLLESGSLGLDVYEVDKGELDSNPALVFWMT